MDNTICAICGLTDCNCHYIYNTSLGDNPGDNPCPGGPQPPLGGMIRTFESGATRDTDAGKPDYEGFLSPRVIQRFGEYMAKHRVQSDGSLRASDNWQKGIPRCQYIKSMFRHFVDVWARHREDLGRDVPAYWDIAMEDALCALLFNVMGYLHEYISKGSVRSEEN